MQPVTEINPNQVYTLDEAAEILRVSKPTIYRWCRMGMMPFSRIGRGYRFLGTTLLSALKANAVE